MAEVVEVGGGIREYRVGDAKVLEPYAIEQFAEAARGMPLLPWPNRIEDGTYEFDGRRHQLPITEVANHNAIHGLLRWQSWDGRRMSESSVEMSARVNPQPGYPFIVETTVTYELSEDGLAVTTSATNIGNVVCPYGAGQHPYLAVGGTTVDECVISFSASTRIEVNDRGIPTGAVAVAGSDYDFGAPRAIGERVLDHAFTDLARDDAGRALVRLERPDGHTVEWWADEAYHYLQLFTADTLPPDRARRSIACEPMSCPANAFNSGIGLVRLEPGEQHRARWGVRLV
jgi:aldose 1-epimerase